jgi:hypothetical protein
MLEVKSKLMMNDRGKKEAAENSMTLQSFIVRI